MRLDKAVQERFSCPSRTYAENLILKGRVLVNAQIVRKPAQSVDDNDEITVTEDENYASQGAYKLVEAFSFFKLTIQGKACVDVGCSNGGFTDVLLRNGAGSVLAIDVGECALAERLLASDKVTFLRANARELPSHLNSTADFICSDVSFISLKLILPSIYKLLKNGGSGILLIKPQFEVGRSALSKDGIVLKEKDRQRAVYDITAFAAACGFKILGITPSPVVYEHKNREYLLYIEKPQ